MTLSGFLANYVGFVPLDPRSIVDVQSVFPSDYDGGTKFEVPSYAFNPDQWTRALLRGLAKFDGFEGKKVLELGIGTGVNAAYVLQDRNPKRLLGSDIDGRCTAIAARNIRRNVARKARRHFRAVLGGRNLASWMKRKGLVDVVYGCLPQIVKAPALDIHEGDNVGHYYDPALYPSKLHYLGLGLNDFALRQLHPLLKPGASVILNLSGRPGRKEALEEWLFRRNGYEPRLLHEEVVQQLPTTSLAALAEIENHHQHQFEFFTSLEGTPESQISAIAAEAMRLAGKAVFHKIYVIEGKVV